MRFLMLVKADERQLAENPPPPEFMPAMGAFVGGSRPSPTAHLRKRRK